MELERVDRKSTTPPQRNARQLEHNSYVWYVIILEFNTRYPLDYIHNLAHNNQCRTATLLAPVSIYYNWV